MEKPKTLRDAIAELDVYRQSRPAERVYVRDWEDTLPPGSMWHPGSIGKPDCVMCLGLGFVSLQLPAGHPLFGRLYACDCVEESEQYRRALRLAQGSGLMPADRGLTWAGIYPNRSALETIDIVKAALTKGWGWLYLHGGAGPGKTLMLKIAVAELVRAGTPAIYVEWAELLDHLRDGYKRGDFDQRLEDWRNVEVLAIDEFGRAKETEWVEEAMLRILNRRYELATVEHKGITLFASNFAPTEFDEWLESRFLDGRFSTVHMVGPDMRPMMK